MSICQRLAESPQQAQQLIREHPRECCLLFVLNIFQVFPASLFPQCPTILPGYTVDRCLLAPLSEDEGETGATTSEKRHLVIPFQNEFLYPAYKHEAGKSETGVICTAPDLISVLGEDEEAIGSQELRYSLKVVVIGMPAHPLWTGDERGLKMGSIEYFGLDVEWESVGKYEKPRSVTEECRKTKREPILEIEFFV
jgi:hypothetical protein